MSSNDEAATSVFEPGELDWIEKHGLENLKGRVGTADILAKESATTLTVLLAGAGGALAYAAKLLDDGASRGTVAASAAAVWLTLLSILLVIRCLKIDAIPPVYNQPGQLLGRHVAGHTLDSWREAELKNIEARIDDACKRNDEVARRLNIVRMLATLTPVLAAMAAGLYIACGH